jgi:hypothetical protein
VLGVQVLQVVSGALAARSVLGVQMSPMVLGVLVLLVVLVVLVDAVLPVRACSLLPPAA